MIAKAKAFLDAAVPLATGSHTDVTAYSVVAGELAVKLKSGNATALKNAAGSAGFQGDAAHRARCCSPTTACMSRWKIDRTSAIGKDDPAGVADMAHGVRGLNHSTWKTWLRRGSMPRTRCWSIATLNGTLSATSKGRQDADALAQCRPQLQDARRQGEVKLHGRSLLLTRNCGHHMFTDAVLDDKGEEIPGRPARRRRLRFLPADEGQLQGQKQPHRLGLYRQAEDARPRRGVATCEIFDRVEKHVLGLPENTLKVGIMDEERRTTVNLKACIASAPPSASCSSTSASSTAADEIHTSHEAGPMIRKNENQGAGLDQVL